MTRKSKQTGAFLMARAWMIVGSLMAMLIIPVYLKKEREDRELAVHKAEIVMSQAPTKAAATATPAASDAVRTGCTARHDCWATG